MSEARRAAEQIPALVLYGLLLTACTGEPVKPDPIAPTVVVGACEPVEIPIPVPRTPPLELLQPAVRDTYADDLVLEAGQGDYGITRGALEWLVDSLRAAGERLARWRAWAGAPED